MGRTKYMKIVYWIAVLDFILFDWLAEGCLVYQVGYLCKKMPEFSFCRLYFP